VDLLKVLLISHTTDGKMQVGLNINYFPTVACKWLERHSNAQAETYIYSVHLAAIYQDVLLRVRR